ncbi:MAG: carboxypeptidase regulatory-like domain-containing protein [Acidobacteriota bacterium]|nr:carboxypeptidase regulatory-like domain-containing protein [Acidobacteriota bacterium]
MFSTDYPKVFLKPILVALTVFSTVFAAALESRAEVVVEGKSNLGVIKGIVRDEAGNPISDATVAIFRLGTSKLLKQVYSASDGSFLAKILPGTYTVLAVAQGFNPVTLSEVAVNRSAELNYGFKLERSGSGNTLPEKKIDRSSSKWRIRAAQSQRSIYQNKEGNAPVDENKTTEAEVEEIAADDREDEAAKRSGQTVVETYFADTNDGSFAGVNFATFLPVGENTEIVVAGQTGSGNAPNRLETSLKFRPDDNHQIQLKTSYGNLGRIKVDNNDKTLGQFSVQGLDEWKVRDDLILVFGFDYSQFTGAGDDFSISPRVGVQFDLDEKTRFRSAFRTTTEEKSWSRAIEFEGSSIAFSEPVAIEDFVVKNNKPQMNKSRRLEFGIERILDNNSSVEANAFLDTTLGRGIGLANLPFDVLGVEDFGDFVANQQGRAQGVRLVYTRRLNSRFSTSAGFALGNGQKLSENGVTNPADVFENDFFQTFFGQFNADLKTGTNVKTIFRLSPQATVFAIDPFQGRLAIYDPGLSVLVTQALPNLGLPFRAEAIVDARNLLDFQTGVSGEEGSLRLNSQRRTLRGGILVRF